MTGTGSPPRREAELLRHQGSMLTMQKACTRVHRTAHQRCRRHAPGCKGQHACNAEGMHQGSQDSTLAVQKACTRCSWDSILGINPEAHVVCRSTCKRFQLTGAFEAQELHLSPGMCKQLVIIGHKIFFFFFENIITHHLPQLNLLVHQTKLWQNIFFGLSLMPYFLCPQETLMLYLQSMTHPKLSLKEELAFSLLLGKKFAVRASGPERGMFAGGIPEWPFSSIQCGVSCLFDEQGSSQAYKDSPKQWMGMKNVLSYLKVTHMG